MIFVGFPCLSVANDQDVPSGDRRRRKETRGATDEDAKADEVRRVRTCPTDTGGV